MGLGRAVRAGLGRLVVSGRHKDVGTSSSTKLGADAVERGSRQGSDENPNQILQDLKEPSLVNRELGGSVVVPEPGSGRHKKFEDRGPDLCGLCKEDPAKEIYGELTSGPCNHQVCQPCLAEYMSSAMDVSDGMLTPNSHELLIRCPAAGSPHACAYVFSRTEVLGVVGEQAVKLYEDWLLDACATMNSDSTLFSVQGDPRHKLHRYLLYLDELMSYLDNLQQRRQAKRQPLFKWLKPRTSVSSKRGRGYGGSLGDLSKLILLERNEQQFYQQLGLGCATVKRTLDSCARLTTAPKELDSATWVLLHRGHTLPKMFHRSLSSASILDLSFSTAGDCYLELLSLLTALGTYHGLLPTFFQAGGSTSAPGPDLVQLGHELGGSTSAPGPDLVQLGHELLNHMDVLYTQAKSMLAVLKRAQGYRGSTERRKRNEISTDGDTDEELELLKRICDSYDILKAQLAGVDQELHHGSRQQANHDSSNSLVNDVREEAENAVPVSSNSLVNDVREEAESAVPVDDTPPSSTTTNAPGITEDTTVVVVPQIQAIEEAIDVEKRYKEALRPLQIRSVDMAGTDGLYSSHHYSSEIKQNAGCHTNHKRMLRIAKELATLASSLPLEWRSSVHLCVDESRSDVMRALIVGPEGTPYQNGMFLFDIFLPSSYPESPPSVHFLTTGGGKVRFNPNLYDSGKVCLSLLGTWRHGLQWIPTRSTLLQVLVSLQSLVFTDEPFHNEPIFHRESGWTAVSGDYNLKIRKSTLLVAILEAVKNPDPYFAEIIRQHFLMKREEIAQQCQSWAATVGFQEELQEQLQHLLE